MKTGTRVNKNIFSAIACAIVFSSAGYLSAQDQSASFTVHVEKSLSPLADGWVKEYSKINPGVSIHLTDQVNNGSSPEIRLFEHFQDAAPLLPGEAAVHAGQVAILPFIHHKNPLFEKELKRGLKHSRLKEIFFAEELDWLDETGKSKDTDYEIYTPVPHSSTAEAFAGFFGKSSDDLKGIYVSGDDAHLLSALRQDSVGIGYSRVSQIFDPATRMPAEGIIILPVDLNNNGRLDKSELIYDNLDQIITYAESTRKPAIPTLQVSLGIRMENLSNPDIEHFINWVRAGGQKVNVQLGFNGIREIIPSELTNK
jgi:phosphate transport system substrate-binding protein